MEVYRSDSEEETRRLGRDLAARVSSGRVLLLYGELGAGKTTFVRGLAEGLGADPEEVHSPTFSLVNQYPARGTILFHIDLYRLETLREQMSIGLEDLICTDGIVAVEWSEHLKLPADQALKIRIKDGQGEERFIEVEESEPPPLAETSQA